MLNVSRWISILVLAGFGAVAVAAEGDLMDTEYLHQPNAGTFELTPGLGGAPGNTALLNQPNGIILRNYNISGSDTKFNLFLVPIMVSADYGISSMFSIGASLTYGSGATGFSNCPSGGTCNSHTIKGLFDPELYFKGRAAIGPGVLQYGVVAEVGVEKSKTDSSGDGNWATGGTTLSPFIAYQLPVGTGALGARFKYDLYKGDRKSTSQTSSASIDSTTSNGNAVSVDAFYEIPVGIVTLGGALIYSSYPETKTASGNNYAKADKNANSIFGLQFYAPVHLSGVTLLPNVAYQSYSFSSSDSGFSSVNALQLGIAARLTF